MNDLEEIEDLAQRQLDGGFSAESDALTALNLIVRLSQEMQRLREEAGLA